MESTKKVGLGRFSIVIDLSRCDEQK